MSQNRIVPSDLPKHPIFVNQNVPSIFSVYLIKLEIANCCEHTGQNVLKSKHPNFPILAWDVLTLGRFALGRFGW